MSFKQKTLVALILLVFFCSISVFAIFFFLPSVLESSVLPELAERIGIDDFSADIRRIGLSGADISDVVIGGNKHAPISIDSIRVNYSFKGIIGNRIDAVVVSGINLACRIESGKVEIDGLNLPKILEKLKKKEKKQESSPTINIDRVLVHNSEITIAHKGEQHKLPFEMQGVVTADNLLYDFRLKLLITDQEVLINFPLDFSQKKALISFAAPSFKLARASHLLSNVTEFSVTGIAEAAGQLHVEFAPFKLGTLIAKMGSRTMTLSILKYLEMDLIGRLP